MPVTTAIITATSVLILLLAAALVALGWRTYQNHLELKRLERNGYRRVGPRAGRRRGCVDPGFLRGLAELLVLILLLATLFSWLSLETPRW